MATWRQEPECDPAEAGTNAAVLDELAVRFADAAQDGSLFSGAQMALFRDGRLVLDVGGGVARPRLGVPVTPETMFVIFSSTKGLATLAIWMLSERAAFDIDDPVVAHWPAFSSQVPEKEAVTIRHVLGHRGGFPTGPAWFTARWWAEREAAVRAMEEVPLQWPPGSANGYHALNFGWVLNELCARIDPRGRDIGAFLREEVFAPLGILGAHVGLPDEPGLEDRVAWVEEPVEPLPDDAATAATTTGGGDQSFRSAAADDPRRLETPELSIPWNRPAVHRAVVPAAGGVATARDLGRVYAALALGGELGGVRLLSHDTIAAALVPTNAPGEVDRTLGTPTRWGSGWHVGTAAEYLHNAGAQPLLDGDPALARAAAATFGHGGRGGQVAWADPERGLAFTFVTTGQLRVRRYQQWLGEMQALALRAPAG